MILITLDWRTKSEKNESSQWDKKNDNNFKHGYLTEWKHFSWAAGHTRHGLFLITSVDRGSMATGKYTRILSNHFKFSTRNNWISFGPINYSEQKKNQIASQNWINRKIMFKTCQTQIKLKLYGKINFQW